MDSIKSVFFLIIWICSTILMDESLKHKICSDTWMAIDSALVPFNQSFVYLISEDLFYKMDIKSSDQLVINSVKKFENWSPNIKPSIDMIFTDRLSPRTLVLKNCFMTTLWFIRYEDNRLERSITSKCGKDFEHIIDPMSGESIYLYYFPVDNKIEVNYEKNFKSLKAFLISCLSDEPNKIRLLDETKPEQFHGTEFFTQINGKRINAAFIYKKNWYLFADRYYCRVGLNEYTFEECKPIPINTLIKDCNEESSEPKETQNTDISLFVIIVFIIIAIAVIAIIVMALFIYREIQKKTTAKTSSVYSF